MNKDEVALGAARAAMNKLTGLFKSRESQVVSLIQVSVRSALDEAEAHWAKDAELNTQLNKKLHTELRELRKKVQATHGPAVVHESCDNPHCNICVGGLYVCSWCGAAEAEAEHIVCTGLKQTDTEQTDAHSGVDTGCRDRNGKPIYLGDKVRYHLQGEHTKQEYWNPEYEVIFVPPSFTLKHIGGGKDGGSHDFKLRHGGGNGDLEVIERGPYHPPLSPAATDRELPEDFQWLDLPVTVRGEDFSYEATCLCSFPKKNGKVRYVVEDRGRLFIQRSEQLEFRRQPNKSTIKDIYERVVAKSKDLGASYGTDENSADKEMQVATGYDPRPKTLKLSDKLREIPIGRGCPQCGHFHPPDGMCV